MTPPPKAMSLVPTSKAHFLAYCSGCGIRLPALGLEAGEASTSLSTRQFQTELLWTIFKGGCGRLSAGVVKPGSL